MDNLIIELSDDSSDKEEIKDIEKQNRVESTEYNKDLIVTWSSSSRNSQSITNENNKSENDDNCGSENFVPAWEIESNSSNSQSQSVKRRRYNSLDEKSTCEKKTLFAKENHDAQNDKHHKNGNESVINKINNKKWTKKKNSQNTQSSDLIIEDEESEEIANHSNADLNIEIDCNVWTSNNWERDIAEIESIEKDSKHGLIVYLTWKSGHRSVEPINILNKYAPQKFDKIEDWVEKVNQKRDESIVISSRASPRNNFSNNNSRNII
ncbi:3528_t:CDS:2 [Diversispora eburnea]|uniref:3528_t:CDS:1 n=1 Tax=Diversispora eburnea TaxID=1213867 RepID=A0A9N9ASM9_9GLOM|nr:3528_t:CDS:2 [Diversispora eburnea]